MDMDPLTAALAFLAALGLGALLWLALGWLLLPVGAGRRVHVELEAGPSLEQDLRGLRWLAASGLLCPEITVLGAGLLPAERAETLRLLAAWPEVSLREEPPERRAE